MILNAFGNKKEIENKHGRFTNSSMLLLFYYLAPLLNDCLRTSRCVHITFGDKRDVYLQDENALPVTKKEFMYAAYFDQRFSW